MKTPEHKRVYAKIPERQMVHDFGWAKGDSGLRAMLDSLNRNGYELVCVTHVCADSYRVFFRRPAP